LEDQAVALHLLEMFLVAHLVVISQHRAVTVAVVDQAERKTEIAVGQEIKVDLFLCLLLV
jgi:hypothetical protein